MAADATAEALGTQAAAIQMEGFNNLYCGSCGLGTVDRLISQQYMPTISPPSCVEEEIGCVCGSQFFSSPPTPAAFTVGNNQIAWAMAGGEVYAWNGFWNEQPGWNVTSLTDHWGVGSGGDVYWWNDQAPNFFTGQVESGNWEGPVIGPPPGAASLVQVAASANTSLWAVDNDYRVWELASGP